MNDLNERGRYDDEQSKLVERDTAHYRFSNAPPVLEAILTRDGWKNAATLTLEERLECLVAALREKAASWKGNKVAWHPDYQFGQGCEVAAMLLERELNKGKSNV